MLPNPVHHILLASALAVALISDPGALAAQFLSNELVRIAVIVIISNLVYAVVRPLQSRRNPPPTSPSVGLPIQSQGAAQ